MPRLDAVMFDLDGTLVDTEPLWRDAKTATMERFGYSPTPADMRATMGAPIAAVAAYLAPLVRVAPDDVSVTLVAEMELLARTRPVRVMPGVRELRVRLEERGIRTGLASNSWRSLLDLTLDRAGFSFEATVAGDEAAAPKPDPAPYVELAARLDADPAFTVVIEDSAPGLAAGLAAGACVLAVPELANEVTPRPGLAVAATLEQVSIAHLLDLVSVRGG